MQHYPLVILNTTGSTSACFSFLCDGVYLYVNNTAPSVSSRNRQSYLDSAREMRGQGRYVAMAMKQPQPLL